jgi:hypothetical protein
VFTGWKQQEFVRKADDASVLQASGLRDCAEVVRVVMSKSNAFVRAMMAGDNAEETRVKNRQAQFERLPRKRARAFRRYLWIPW